MQKYDTLIFDFDGTLVDSLPLQITILKQLAGRYHLPQLSDTEISILRQQSLRQLINKYHISVWRLFFLTREVQAQMQQQWQQVAIFPGFQRLLPELARSYQLAIVTSNSKVNVERILAKLTVYFFCIEAEKKLFAKAKKIKKILKKFNLSPKRALYIGDEVRDIEACHQAGIDCVAVTWGLNDQATLQAAQPTYLVKNVAELKQLLLSVLK